MKATHYLARAVACALLSITPVAAPAIGFILMAVCPVDQSIVADGPFSLHSHRCGIWQPVEVAYQGSAWLLVLPMMALGKIAGGLVAICWLIIGLAALAATCWYSIKALIVWHSPRG